MVTLNMMQTGNRLSGLLFNNPNGENWDQVEGTILLNFTEAPVGISIRVRKFLTGTKTGLEFCYTDRTDIRSRGDSQLEMSNRNKLVNKTINDSIGNMFDELDLEIKIPFISNGFEILPRLFILEVDEEKLSNILNFLLERGFELREFYIDRYVSRNEDCTFSRIITYNNKFEVKNAAGFKYEETLDEKIIKRRMEFGKMRYGDF